MKNILFDVLDTCLNDGCVDARCDLGAGATGGSFSAGFIEHLVEEIIDAISAD